MSNKSLVHNDMHGIFVRTGGYIFRPKLSRSAQAQGYFEQTGTHVGVGQHVKARHIGGTATARIVLANGRVEQWFSHGDSMERSRVTNSGMQWACSDKAWAPAGTRFTTGSEIEKSLTYTIQEEP